MRPALPLAYPSSHPFLAHPSLPANQITIYPGSPAELVNHITLLICRWILRLYLGIYNPSERKTFLHVLGSVTDRCLIIFQRDVRCALRRVPAQELYGPKFCVDRVTKGGSNSLTRASRRHLLGPRLEGFALIGYMRPVAGLTQSPGIKSPSIQWWSKRS